SIRRNRDKPAVSLGHRSRSSDEDSVRGPHQGQQSFRTASTGRTHDCKRPLCSTPIELLPSGGHPHMRRREFVSLLGGAATWPLVARAKQSERMRRIGVLIALPEHDEGTKERLAGLQLGLKRLGWFEGRTIQIDYRFAGLGAQAQPLAKELVALQPDLILSQASPPTRALQQETQTIPIVFVGVADPIGSGFVASLARPG